MPKKSRKAPVLPVEEDKKPATKEDKKPATKEHKKPATKKPRNEIDDIFAGKKKKKLDKDNVRKHDVNDKEEKKRINKTAKNFDRNTDVKESGGSGSGVGGGGGSRQRKRTADGLTIYTEEELGIAKRDAGATPLCPFDCDCCF